MKMENDGEQIKLLPDSGLPVEEEVRRNIDDTLEEFENTLSKKGKKLTPLLRSVFKKALQDLAASQFEKQIQERRSDETDEFR